MTFAFSRIIDAFLDKFELFSGVNGLIPFKIGQIITKKLILTTRSQLGLVVKFYVSKKRGNVSFL